MSELSDAALLARWLKGDERAFTELMRRHEDRIFALGLKMLGERADALEATQETFITAFRQAHTFRGESAFGTWLYRVGINTCRDLLRKRARTPVPDEAAVEALQTTTIRAVDEVASVRLDVRRALEELPEEYRIAVVMHDLGQIPYEEVARITGSPIGTVKSRISRGRKMLAATLEHPGGARSSKEQP